MNLLFTVILLVVNIGDLILKTNFPSEINYGIAFGIGANLQGGSVLWVAIFFLILGYAIISKQWLWLHLASAGLSNFVDRIVFGGVRDYLVLAGISFNLSDICLNLLVTFTVIRIIWQYVKKFLANKSSRPKNNAGSTQ